MPAINAAEILTHWLAAINGHDDGRRGWRHDRRPGVAHTRSMESRIRNGAVAEWRVFADNKPVYDILARRRPAG